MRCVFIINIYLQNIGDNKDDQEETLVSFYAAFIQGLTCGMD